MNKVCLQPPAVEAYKQAGISYHVKCITLAKLYNMILHNQHNQYSYNNIINCLLEASRFCYNCHNLCIHIDKAISDYYYNNYMYAYIFLKAYMIANGYMCNKHACRSLIA